jgi:hypothetical protein
VLYVPVNQSKKGGLCAMFERCFFDISEVLTRKRVGRINAESVLGVRGFLIFYSGSSDRSTSLKSPKKAGYFL